MPQIRNPLTFQLFGDKGRDRLSGGANSVVFSLTGDGDMVSDGSQPDEVTYMQAPAAVTVELRTGEGGLTGSVSPSDQLTGIENITGTGQFSDTLRGDTRRNIIKGLLGNDSIFRGAGPDLLFGGLSTDHLFGGIGDDSIDGGVGTDYADGGGGIDTCTSIERPQSCESLVP